MKDTIVDREQMKQVEYTEDTVLVVTDPCYILSEEAWNRFTDVYIDLPRAESDQLEAVFQDQGYQRPVLAMQTGIGDWGNEVINTDTQESLGAFAADAGMVCVVALEDLRETGFDMEEYNRLKAIGCLAELPPFTGTVTWQWSTSQLDGTNIKLNTTVIIGEGNYNFSTYE